MLLFSPAKLNLFFRVLRKREDGYHDISSLFQAISLGDTLSLSIDTQDSFTCSNPELPLDSSNLVIKALHLFRKKTSIPFSVRIHLDKQIPMEAGLGGGSSNAATTLWGLNKLLGNPATEKELAVWGSELGSDVPFFFSTGTAFCQGRGEIVESTTLIEPFSAYLAKPHFGLSTPKVYGAIHYSELSSTDDLYKNDLEKPAFRLKPELAQFKQSLLRMGFSHVCMTGSGTCFFCLGTPSASIFPLIKTFGISRSLNSWY